jgi:uncharacterized protein (DUF1800 family)
MTGATEAFIAANRFGFGPRPGELAAIGRDPRGWLKAQVAAPPALPGELAAMPPASDGMARFLKSRHGGQEAIMAAFRDGLTQRARDEIDARALAMVLSKSGLVERLTAFWSNHFTVSSARFFIGPVAGGYEREAIRPHLFGRFRALLGAVVRHPAMLMYLDNAGSVGPASIGGRISKLGINENLAREILELHTLGVNGGYTQKDVTEFARILTGWSVEGLGRQQAATGRFHFVPAAHEPGPKTLLGKVYDQGGMAEGEAALDALARHPSTARFIVTKLARHFVADDPPPAAVERLASVFRASDGDLRAVTLALIDLPQAWQTPLAKVKSAHDFAVSAFRAAGLSERPERGFLPVFFTLRQVPFSAPSPAGWPDKAADWISPEALMRRLEFAQLAGRSAERRAASPEALLAATIAPVATPGTRQAILAAASPGEAVALTFASAEFQRR